jgi:uncharacterized protein YjbJ (UPF0337 family)
MNTKYFCSGLALAGRPGPSAILLGGLLLSSISVLAQGLPAPPPPPSPSSVVHAVQGAANQATGAVTNLTGDQRQKAEEAKRQLEAKLKAAAEALARQVGQRVTQLNTYYSDQRKTRQASQKAQLNQRVMVKASGLATAQRAPVGKTTPASGGPSPQPKPGGSSQKPGSVGSSASPAPTIANLSAISGEPGDPILVTGTGFTAATEVYFLVAPNRQEKANIGFSGETQLMVEVPLVTGIPAFSGLVLVKREDGQVSQGSPFRFTPRTVVVGYHFDEVITDATLHNDGGADKDIRGSNSVNGSGFSVSHFSWSLVGFKLDDILFPSTRLNNGWVVEDVVFNGNSSPLQGKAELREFGKGSNALKMKVHGWTTAQTFGLYGYVCYFGQILIRGPEGVSYK